jgi:hypothetical protein
MYPVKNRKWPQVLRKGQQFMHSGICQKEKWKECRWIVNYKTRHLGCMKYVHHWQTLQWLWDVDYIHIVQARQLSLCFWSMINVKINWYQFEFKHTIPGICQYLVENNSDSDSCRKLTLLFVYVYVVIHFCECVIFLSESEYSMKESLYSDGTKQIHQYQHNEQPPLSSNIAHKTNHDIRRWQSKPWHTKQTTT